MFSGRKRRVSDHQSIPSDNLVSGKKRKVFRKYRNWASPSNKTENVRSKQKSVKNSWRTAPARKILSSTCLKIKARRAGVTLRVMNGLDTRHSRFQAYTT